MNSLPGPLSSVFTNNEIDLMHWMFEQLWDDMRHEPADWDDISSGAADRLFDKLKKLGAV